MLNPLENSSKNQNYQSILMNNNVDGEGFKNKRIVYEITDEQYRTCEILMLIAKQLGFE